MHAVTTPSTLSRWIPLVAAGELAGFVVPAVFGVALADSPLLYPAILLAGFVEGLALGGAQCLAMRPHLPALRLAPFVLLTGSAAVVAYAFGMLPSVSVDIWSAWSVIAQVGAAAVIATAVLLSIGLAQWIVLRHHLRRSGWWILGTAIAWLGGLGAFFAIAPPLWHEAQAVAVAILIGVVAGLALAVVMATITGLVFFTLLRRTSPEARLAATAGV